MRRPGHPAQEMNIPSHIAVIMDGNGRWAKSRGKARLQGHRAGADTVERVLDCCEKYGVRYLTLYAFSTENWKRPEQEVSGLMRLLDSFLKAKAKTLVERKVRFRAIGRITDLPESLQRRIANVEAKTRDFDRVLSVCLSYGGRAEIADAATKIAEAARNGTLKPGRISEEDFASFLYAPDIPDPELVIRTSGELRLSNFLLWQAAYSEIYVTPVLWPDFGEADFVAALEDYSRRSRRFGGIDPEAAK